MERNTMQYGNDNFEFRKRAKFKSVEGWDCTRETAIRGFEISASVPDGCNLRIIFEVDGKLYYFTNDGLTRYREHGELEDILREGNTVGQLLAVDGVVQWVGKKIYPIIAMDAPRDAELFPKIKISLKVSCYLDEYSRDYISPVFEVNGRITGATFNKANNGAAVSTAFISLRDVNGNWSDFVDFDSAKNKVVSAVQFKAHHVLTTLDGSDSAQIFDCNLDYITSADRSAGNVQEMVFKTLEADADLGTCYVVVNHTELLDADIQAFVKYDSATLTRDNLIIGRGTGNWETYYLGTNGGIDPAINQNSLRITAGDFNITDFYYNIENATVDLKVDAGVDIFASYEYNLPAEFWVPMAKQYTSFDGEKYSSRFIYRNSQDNRKKAAIKITLTRGSGKVVDEKVGIATGNIQLIPIQHRAKLESITCSGVWSYDENTQILKVLAEKDTDIKMNYDWCGLMPMISRVYVGWAVL